MIVIFTNNEYVCVCEYVMSANLTFDRSIKIFFNFILLLIYSKNEEEEK